MPFVSRILHAATDSTKTQKSSLSLHKAPDFRTSEKALVKNIRNKEVSGGKSLSKGIRNTREISHRQKIASKRR
jgi:hypothetical protein